MPEARTLIAFADTRNVAEGPLPEVLAILKRRWDKNPGDTVLVFEVESGRQVDFELHLPLEELLERTHGAPAKGPGRPRLGVVGREISLLPRHWDWLEAQPNGISAALRRLVELAMKREPGREKARRIRAALSPMLSALAGNRPHYEEACRALFAGDVARFEECVGRWPKDIQAFMLARARIAARAEREDVATESV